jgi:hypothetical protein
MTNLSVKPAGSALVPDYEALEGGVLRFIGRRHDPSIGKNGGWVPVEGVVSIPNRSEYLQEIKAGALIPADKQTADAAGVPFTQKAKSKDSA